MVVAMRELISLSPLGTTPMELQERLDASLPLSRSGLIAQGHQPCSFTEKVECPMKDYLKRTGKLVRIRVKGRIGRLISLKLWEKRYGSKNQVKN